MKRYIIAITAFLSLWSCQTDEEYENLNRDPKNPTEVASDFLFTAATVSLSDNMASPNVNDGLYRFLAQYWTTTTYLDEPNYNLTSRNNPDNVWSEIYRDVLYDLKDARSIVMENEELSQAEKDARLGQIEVIEVYAWHVLVDTFGDIPYSEALQPDNSLPVYDNDEVIYEDLISRLESVDALLSAGQGYTTADVIYGGDMDQWLKFANSLSLRLGMRISQSNPQLAQSTVESAVSDGVFTSNGDNATIEYLGTFPNTNPLWEDLVQSGRSDFLASATIVDYMNELNDPRRMSYFDDNISGGYLGGVYGGSNNYSAYTHIGDPFLNPTREGILLDYVEVAFNLSRAAEIGYSAGGDAESHYENAITASIMYWGGSEAQVTAYLAQPAVSYDGSVDQFALQYWIAMFDNPFQGWSIWRKYDEPELVLPEEFGTPVPLRFTYPVDEQNLNEDNYIDASEAIGEDDQQTPVFWDVDME
ncbi:SusD/RagB family nutrient-binding outer membrane lipoprotein [Autumnicola psychrophila]|uniref:SusD/RagB family nutrient-binding outer membrane lipoprotein n=1 Tax=Autumnicola psychrophila TaxID=3075592 RepID=A0ABU3DMB9_9FLAO|nr:SusD/RagB family nutrient-binding outer membrane lipoprotein [Zunongwangia sp. F225]MDT0684856.1 SusD/RagB family nutrient-binding outer membrane lipoprotein [Zunongwangia sp. F225]